MFRVRAFRVIIHVASWLLFMAFPLLFIHTDRSGSLLPLLSAPYYWLFCFSYIFLFYINAYLLIPLLFLKKRYAWYGLATLALLACVYFLQPYDKLLRSTDTGGFPPPGYHSSPMKNELRGRGIPPPQHDGQMPPYPPGNGQMQRGPGPSFLGVPHLDSTSLFIFVMIMALGTAIKIIEQWQMTEQRVARAEADKASAELSFLKAQINPHFLFNTLNNIYTLTVIKDDHAPESIMKLSNIMRYVTDDAMEDFVSLESEIACIRDYIELQKLRLGDKTTIHLDISGDIEGKSIAPLILMTFIENVFKYGVSKNISSDITIMIGADKTSVSFFCQNRIFPRKDSGRKGIGLQNTRQRLAHMYPDKHLLSIYTDHELYTVKLLIETT